MTRTEANQHLHGEPSSLGAASALLVLLCFTSMGCTTVLNVPTRELAKLDGFREDQSSFLSKLDPRVPSPPTYRLIDEDGDVHTFNASSRLVLDIRAQGRRDEIEARYGRINVNPELFIGLERGSSREIRVPTAQINKAGLRKFSAGKTIGLLAAIAGVGLLTLVIIAAALPSSNGSSSHHNFD